ncbi:MAG: ABC transporter permease [Gemmatimonadota bacterium]|nr:ABC transporter permease [Gemmatimonadota bacterium]MDE3004999.1 ABC transporter permease [Gemmatimonadota bacterium]MDE3014993.1 ABC transporter permease [Gemmatimonadota bacterium]
MSGGIAPARAREVALLGFGAVALTLGAGGLLLLAGGYDPGAAGAAMLRGSVGSWNTFVSITLVRSVPLLFAGLAVALAFRAGVWNIGAEGQLYAGAIAGVWVALTFDGFPTLILIPAMLAMSCVAGAAWALIPTLMRLRLGIGEVITTILMNFVGIYTAAWMVHGPLQEERGIFPQTDRIVEAARLPSFIPGTRLHLGFALGLVIAIGLAVLFRRTRFGFQIRAVGASPEAAAVAGRIEPSRVIFITFLASGAIAGLAGAVEVSGLTYALYENLSEGWGYTAIAVALLAGLRPGGVVVTAIFFGSLRAGAGAMQRDAGIPSAWVDVVEALVILGVLGLERVRAARIVTDIREGDS